MKKGWQIRAAMLGLAVGALLLLGVIGCSESKQAPPVSAPPAEEHKDEAKPADKAPAPTKPKDHPAH